MRVALVMAGDEEGGLEKHVVELANGLASRHIDVSVVAHPKYAPRFDSKIGFLPADLSASRRNPLALWRLWRALRGTSADLVHAHGSKAASMVAPLLPLLRLRSVATLHSRKKNVRMFRRFQRVIAVSRISTLNLDHPGVRIIHNCIRVSTARPQPATDAWEAAPLPHVLAIGRLVPVKGFDVLIEAWKDIDAQLCIAGEGFAHARLQALIDSHGVGHRVKLLGHRDDVPALLAASNLFVISSHYEGCPYTLVEALHAGIPVVSTRVGAMPEILPEEALCPPGDPAALAQLVRFALRDMPGLEVRFAGVFEHARRELTFERLLDRTIAVYEELTE